MKLRLAQDLTILWSTHLKSTILDQKQQLHKNTNKLNSWRKKRTLLSKPRGTLRNSQKLLSLRRPLLSQTKRMVELTRFSKFKLHPRRNIWILQLMRTKLFRCMKLLTRSKLASRLVNCLMTLPWMTASKYGQSTLLSKTTHSIKRILVTSTFNTTIGSSK